MSKKIKITLAKRTFCSQQDQIATIRGLGLRKLNSHVIHDFTPAISGMVKKVEHLIKTEEQ